MTAAYTINPNNSGSIKLALTGVTPLVEYACQIVNAAVVPTANTTPTPGTYCQAPVETPGLSSWALEVSFLQDWGNTPSLSEFVFTNDGELCDFEFQPDNPGVPGMSGTVYVVAGPYGGAAGEAWQAQTLRWPCSAKPTTIAPALLTASAAAADTE
jgi:hypothetical protein